MLHDATTDGVQFVGLDSFWLRGWYSSDVSLACDVVTWTDGA